jgi:hypothetical protein
MYIREHLIKARHQDMLRAAGQDRLATQARQARDAETTIPHPAAAVVAALTSRGPRTGHGSRWIPRLGVLARRVLALVSMRGLRAAR